MEKIKAGRSSAFISCSIAWLGRCYAMPTSLVF